MKLSEQIRRKALLELDQLYWGRISTKVAQLEGRLASARAIMQKFVDKVDSGRARSTETYAEMKQWMEDE